ncbi:MAG: hypothetical protein K0Q60_1747 [Microvirga sp.]|nr:hypothetical protein [Microvirga sp.]
MSDEAGSVAVRLWRDRAQLREEERNDAQAPRMSACALFTRRMKALLRPRPTCRWKR